MAITSVPGKVVARVPTPIYLGRWLVVSFFALQTAVYALQALWVGPAAFDWIFRAKYATHFTLVRVHGVAGVCCLVLGLLQFRRRRTFHRPLGYVYVSAVLIAALTGIPMAWMAEGGLPVRSGLFLFDLAWLATAALALRSARRRSWGEHRRWMARNYALTYGAVLMRLILQCLQATEYDFELIYPVATWGGWLMSLAIRELLLREAGPQSQD